MTQTIRYGGGGSSLGPFLAAVSGRGLAFLAFDADRATLAARFPGAELVEDADGLREAIAELGSLIDGSGGTCRLPLDLQGSDFERRVWQALRDVPAGTTATYGEIAARLGVPRQAREVGEACAANTLAVVVPCHRIVKKDGSISGYRWGVRRKRELLAREHSARLLRPVAAVPHGTAAF
ncbi:methylated-DNA--[protein]-cysteine S-methyltransferase [Reyranella sp.]|uniref:methylated-DNA--[protein]-cysteine S-methyltransferase n=1 Tax=Reyranella sp. TaxID=1929291 RepID=UPI003BA87A2F